jgi:phosphoribosylanthranilate isomerase
MKIKVCGMNYSENIFAVKKARPDYMGFIFYDASPRYVMETLDVESVRAVSSDMDTVGVFVNEGIKKVKLICQTYHLKYAQLHGDESSEYCAMLQKSGVKIIKAFRVDDQFDFESIAPCIPYIDLFLFDTRGSQRGGTGKKFNWALLDRYECEVPFLLSGGISIEDVNAILKCRHPQMHGVDINSRFETFPGMKDVELVSEFIENLSHAI